jgi:hypothetical protein
MGEIVTPIFDTSMNVIKGFYGFTSLRTTLSQLAHLTLDAFQVFLVLLHPALSLNRFTVRERGEGGQAQVYPYHLRRYRQRLWLNLARKAGVPVTQRIALDGESFDSTLDRPMKLDFNIAYFGQSQTVVSQLKPRLFEGETVIPAKALVSRKAILMAFSDPAKERLESKVYPLLDVLQNLRVNLFKFRMVIFPAGQFLIGIVQAQRFSLLFPRATAQIKRTIVDLATRLKGIIQASALRFGWIKSVLECFTHNEICVNCSMDILFEQINPHRLEAGR